MHVYWNNEGQIQSQHSTHSVILIGRSSSFSFLFFSVFFFSFFCSIIFQMLNMIRKYQPSLNHVCYHSLYVMLSEHASSFPFTLLEYRYVLGIFFPKIPKPHKLAIYIFVAKIFYCLPSGHALLSRMTS